MQVSTFTNNNCMKKIIFTMACFWAAQITYCQTIDEFPPDSTLSIYDNLVFKDFKKLVKLAETYSDTLAQLKLLDDICEKCNYYAPFTYRVAKKKDIYLSNKSGIKQILPYYYYYCYIYSPPENKNYDALLKDALSSSYQGNYDYSIMQLNKLIDAGFESEKMQAYKICLNFLKNHSEPFPLTKEEKANQHVIVGRRRDGWALIDKVSSDMISNIRSDDLNILIMKKYKKMAKRWLDDPLDRNVDYYHWVLAAMMTSMYDALYENKIDGFLGGISAREIKKNLKNLKNNEFSKKITHLNKNFRDITTDNRQSQLFTLGANNLYSSVPPSYLIDECNTLALDIITKTEKSFQWAELMLLSEKCMDNANIFYYLGNHFQLYKEKIDDNWLGQSLTYYSRAVEIDSNFVQARWNLANTLEYLGLFKQAIFQYNKISKTPPEYYQKRELYGKDKITIVNYAEESRCHMTACKFILKTRGRVDHYTDVLTTSDVDKLDFKPKSIAERSGLEPIKQIVEEVEKQQNYKTKDPNVRGKAIDLTLMALGWAIAPKDMKIEQRNQFIIGALSTIVSLIDKDKIEINNGGLSTQGMLYDLAELKTNPAAKNAETAFSKLQPPSKATAPSETKKIETAGGVTISDKWEATDISGEWECIDCGESGKIGTKSAGEYTTITTFPLKIVKNNDKIILQTKWETKFSGFSTGAWETTPGHTIQNFESSTNLSGNTFTISNWSWTLDVLQKSITRQISGLKIANPFENKELQIPTAGSTSDGETKYEIISNSEIKFTLISSKTQNNPGLGVTHTLRRVK